MKKGRAVPRKRRTTLTLPADALSQAEGIARAKRVNLSVVVAEALASGLRLASARERSAQVLRDYREAFSDFTTEEVMILDGIIPKSPAKR